MPAGAFCGEGEARPEPLYLEEEQALKMNALSGASEGGRACSLGRGGI